MMKLEKPKKLWLWLGIGALALAVVIAAVCLVLFLKPAAPGQQVRPTETAKPVTYKLCWNPDRGSFTELSPRKPDIYGFFTLRMVCDGQLVEYQAADRQLVELIDTMDLVGLAFDESGILVDAVEPKTAAAELATDYYIRSLEGTALEVNSALDMGGMPVTVTLEDTVYITDVRPESLGQLPQLQPMDRVTVYGTADGRATHVFLTWRQPETGVYLRLEDLWDSAAGATTRLPDETGCYTLKMAHEGQPVELKCKDQTLVAAIDSAQDRFMGLYLDESGYITGTVPVNQAIHGMRKCSDYHVVSMDGQLVTVEQLLGRSGQQETFRLTPETKIINADPVQNTTFEFLGQTADRLKTSDCVTVFTDMTGNARYIFLTKRMIDVPLYYNMTPQWNRELGETGRLPDESGFYLFDVAFEGKTGVVKTRDKAIASRIDSAPGQLLGMKVQGNLITGIYHPTCVTGYLPVGDSRFVTELTGNVLRLASGENAADSGNFILAEGARVFNITGDYGTKFYQKDTLRQHDRVVALRDLYGDVCYLLILQRYYEDTKLYYNINRKFDTGTQETGRKPNVSGYYVFDMVCNGKRLEIKTKSREFATIIDRQSPAFVAMKVSGGVVKSVYPATCGLPSGQLVANGQYIGKLEGETLQTYTRGDSGEEQLQNSLYTMAKGCKIYNLSENYEKAYGETTKLRLHDKILAFATGENRELHTVFVLQRKLDSAIYWQVSPQYDATARETTRTPDADGWYYVDLLVKGQIKTFKTKDKSVMSRVDSFPEALAMEVKEDVIRKVDEESTALDYICAAYYLDVSKLTSKKVTVEQTRASASDFGRKVERERSKKCKIYDVTGTAEVFGAETTVQAGDRVVVYTNRSGQAVEIYLVSRNTHKDGPQSLCPHCKKKVYWQPYLGTVYQGSDHYYLATDYKAWQQAVGRDDAGATTWDVVLDLNGKTLSSYNRNFLVYDKLTVLDLAGGGKVESDGVEGWASNFLVLNGGELTLRDVTVTTAENVRTSTMGGLIYAANASRVRITGGLLYGGKTSGTGGAMYLLNATVELSGGEIRDCTAAEAPGIYLAGGSIANISGTAALNALGGSDTCQIKLSGTPKLQALTVPEEVRVTLGELADGADITVSANGLFTAPHEKIEQYKAYFKPAIGQTPIMVLEGALYSLVDTTFTNDPLAFRTGTQEAWCVVCHKLVTWTPITGTETAVQLLSGHYYLAKDITVTAPELTREAYLCVTGGIDLGSICLHLNGHSLTVPHRAIVAGERPLNVLGNGTVTGAGTGIGGAAVQLNAPGSAVNLYGGVYTKAATDTESAIVYIGEKGGTVQLYEGATVDATGKQAATLAAGIHLVGGTGEGKGPAAFHMHGGLVKNGTTAGNGGNLHLAGPQASAVLSGGTVTGGKATGSGGNIYCSGGSLQLEAVTVTDGTAGGEGGNLCSLDGKSLVLQGAILRGGTATGNGGNVSLTRTGTTIEKGTLIEGGTTQGSGGSLQVTQAAVIMNGGQIQGGKCQSQDSHNVWLSGTAEKPAGLLMRGGKLQATANHAPGGSALYLHSYARAWLAGDAAILDDGIGAGVRVAAGCSLNIVDGWTGSANAAWAETYAPGAALPTTAGQTVKLDENLVATPGGAFTGKLCQLSAGVLTAILATAEGTLQLQLPPTQ